MSLEKENFEIADCRWLIINIAMNGRINQSSDKNLEEPSSDLHLK